MEEATTSSTLEMFQNMKSPQFKVKGYAAFSFDEPPSPVTVPVQGTSLEETRDVEALVAENARLRARLGSAEEQVTNLKEVLKRSKGLIVKLMHEQTLEREARVIHRQQRSTQEELVEVNQENQDVSNASRQAQDSLSGLQRIVAEFSSLISTRNEAHREQIQKMNRTTIEGLNSSRANIFACKISNVLDIRTYRQSALKLSFLRLQSHSGFKKIEACRRQNKLREVLRRKDIETKRRTLSVITEDGYTKAIRELHESQQKLVSSREMVQTIVRKRLKVLDKKAERQAIAVAFARLLRHSRVYTHNQQQQNIVRLYSRSCEYTLKTQQYGIGVLLQRQALRRWASTTRNLLFRDHLIQRLVSKTDVRQKREGLMAFQRNSSQSLEEKRRSQCAALAVLQEKCSKLAAIDLLYNRSRSFALWRKQAQTRSCLESLIIQSSNRGARRALFIWKCRHTELGAKRSKLKGAITMFTRQQTQAAFKHLQLSCTVLGQKALAARVLLCRLTNLDTRNRLYGSFWMWRHASWKGKHAHKLLETQTELTQKIHSVSHEKEELRKFAKGRLLDQQSEMQRMKEQFQQALRTSEAELLLRSLFSKCVKLALHSAFREWKAMDRKLTLLRRCCARFHHKSQVLAFSRWHTRSLRRKNIQLCLHSVLLRQERGQIRSDLESCFHVFRTLQRKAAGAKSLHFFLKRQSHARLIEAWHKYVSYVKWIVTCGALRKVKELRARSSSQRKAYKFVRFVYGFEEKKSAEANARLSLEIAFRAIVFHSRIASAREHAKTESAKHRHAFDEKMQRSNSQAMGLWKLETVFSGIQQKREYFRWWKSNTLWNSLLGKARSLESVAAGITGEYNDLQGYCRQQGALIILVLLQRNADKCMIRSFSRLRWAALNEKERYKETLQEEFESMETVLKEVVLKLTEQSQMLECERDKTAQMRQESILMERYYQGNVDEMQEKLLYTWDEYHALIRKEISAGVGVNESIAKILRRFSKFRKSFPSGRLGSSREIRLLYPEYDQSSDISISE